MILQRYILRQLVAAFALTFTAVIFICIIAMIFQTLRAVAGGGILFVLRSVPIALAYMAPWALVLSTCVSTTLVYGRLAAENEIDAIVTSGIHPQRIFTPAILFGLMLSVGSYGLNEYVYPKAHYNKRVMIRESILFVLQSPPPGNQTFRLGPKYMLSYVHFDDGLMERPLLVEDKGDGTRRESFAKAGRFVFEENEPPTLILFNGEVQDITPKGRHRISGEGDVRIRLEMEELYKRPKQAEDLSTAELKDYARTARNPRHAAAAITELHARPARSLAPLFLVIVSMSIGVCVRKGSRMAGLGASLPPFLVYLVLHMFGEGLGANRKIAPVLAAWMQDAGILLLGLPFLIRAYRR